MAPQESAYTLGASWAAARMGAGDSARRTTTGACADGARYVQARTRRRSHGRCPDPIRSRTPTARLALASRDHCRTGLRADPRPQRVRQMSLRGLVKARCEWLLVCATHNLLKLWRAATAPGALGHDATWPRGVRRGLSGCLECPLTGQHQPVGREPDALTNPGRGPRDPGPLGPRATCTDTPRHRGRPRGRRRLLPPSLRLRHSPQPSRSLRRRGLLPRADGTRGASRRAALKPITRASLQSYVRPNTTARMAVTL